MPYPCLLISFNWMSSSQVFSIISFILLRAVDNLLRLHEDCVKTIWHRIIHLWILQWYLLFPKYPVNCDIHRDFFSQLGKGRFQRYILRWQNHVKAKIAQIVDKILCITAVIARVTSKFGIWGGKNLLV